MPTESYVKEAFLMPQNLLGLGAGVAASIALPFASSILIGLAVAEVIYLKTMSGNPRFQRMIRSRRGR
jgi:hypothetical protein